MKKWKFQFLVFVMKSFFSEKRGQKLGCVLYIGAHYTRVNTVLHFFCSLFICSSRLSLKEICTPSASPGVLLRFQLAYSLSRCLHILYFVGMSLHFSQLMPSFIRYIQFVLQVNPHIDVINIIVSQLPWLCFQ